MKLVIKDRYNVVVNDYARKVVVSKNLCFGGLNSEYPNATTPLSDTDKLIIRQGSEWKQVDKSEIGGGGGVIKHSELTLDDGTNPHGTNRADMGIIEVDNTPTTWQPNAIYFVRNTGQIWQTDSNGVAVLMSISSVGYNELKQELKSTVQVTGTNIDWAQGVAFQVPELTADTTFTFSNVQENKQIKLYLKGNFAFSFPTYVDVSNVNYDGAVWNIIVLEAININGSQTIKAYSI